MNLRRGLEDLRPVQPDVGIGLGPGDLPAGAGLVQAELVGEGERSVPSFPPLPAGTRLPT